MDDVLNTHVTAIKGGFEDNCLTDLRPMFRFLDKPSLAVTVSDFAKQREQKSEGIPPDSKRFPKFIPSLRESLFFLIF